MLVVALNPGHDGAVAVLKDGRLELSAEAEKDSYHRYQLLSPMTILGALEHVDDFPDVVALSGWWLMRAPGKEAISGYWGAKSMINGSKTFFGREVKWFSSSHERSHIATAVGMAPRDESPERAVLVWEGIHGFLYLLDESHAIVKRIRPLRSPGWRYALLFEVADPAVPDDQPVPRMEAAGKLMALAAYGDPDASDPSVVEAVDSILAFERYQPGAKANLRDSPLYNVGVEAEITKSAAAVITRRIFDTFARAAEEQLPSGIPLHISGGCGLNCDWNSMWREHGQFSSVFVPPCPNDSGSAIGTAIDAHWSATGDPYIEWDVYSGLEFEHNVTPDSAVWQRQDLRLDAVADALAGGRVFAWVQGRWEIGPRALGNRSLLAEPFKAQTRDRLNEIKQRERYRPVAPCCRIEDAGKAFDQAFEDPWMLYFRTVRSDQTLDAVTHVDRSARCQTVSAESNKPLHDLLSAFAERHGIGVLCNTSLNVKGRGFINRMSELLDYCEERGIDDFVVGDEWFTRTGQSTS
jgi:hydroxymethyl cephem carbamoyltransferase